MPNSDILIGVVLDEAYLTLEQLSALCAAEPEWIIRHIEEGHLPALPGDSTLWRFSSDWLRRAHRILNIERNFDAAPELAALVADLQEELDDLRRRLQRSGVK